MQTAVEWLIQKLTEKPITDINDEYWFGIIGEAKEMEKQQIEEAFYCGNQIYGNWDADSTIYYNETYGSKGSDDNHAYCGIIDCKCTTSPQTEISDKEIENKSLEYKYKLNQEFFSEGAKWYREQLKKKQ